MKLASSPAEKFLDHHARPGGAEAPLGEHGVDGGVGLIARRRDHHALAGGQAVGLDHDRRALLGDIGLGLRRVLEAAMARRRQSMAHHEALGKILGGLELRRGAQRAEDLEAGVAEGVDDAFGERRFRPDHGEVDVLAPAEVDQLRRSR